MMNRASIGGQLAQGLLIAACLSGVILFGFVVRTYGLFSPAGPPAEDAWLEIQEHVVLPLLIFLSIFGFGAFIAVRRVSRHLAAATREVVDAAARLGSYEPELTALPSEVRSFAEALGDLTERLQLHARRQEAFAADAAHELKTPLSVMLLQLDQLQGSDAKPLRAQLRAMSDMVDQLLLLAKSQSPGTSSLPPVDLDSIGRRVAAELAPIALAKGRDIAFVSKGPESVSGLEEAVGAAVRTLSINAIAASPKGTEVVIEAGPGKLIRVLDAGEGIPPGELDRLKARGVRADTAPGGGEGLGLAIADRIAEAHGGELVIAKGPQAGLALAFN